MTIHSFNSCLLSVYYVPDTLLGLGCTYELSRQKSLPSSNLQLNRKEDTRQTKLRHIKQGAQP